MPPGSEFHEINYRVLVRVCIVRCVAGVGDAAKVALSPRFQRVKRPGTTNAEVERVLVGIIVCEAQRSVPHSGSTRVEFNLEARAPAGCDGRDRLRHNEEVCGLRTTDGYRAHPEKSDAAVR